MSGHVFVTCADLRKLASDAWLLPADGSLHVSSIWELDHLPKPTLPHDWGHTGVRVVRGKASAADDPRHIWLTNVGSGDRESIEWFVEGACQFIRAAVKGLRGQPPKRARHL